MLFLPRANALGWVDSHIHTPAQRSSITHCQSWKFSYCRTVVCPIPGEYQAVWLFWAEHLSSAAPEFCCRCEKIHWCHLKVPLLAITISRFLSATCLPEDWHTSVSSSVSRVQNINDLLCTCMYSKRDEIWKCWDLEGELVLLWWFSVSTAEGYIFFMCSK